MAFDALETPFGKVDRIIGGSATYVAWAASNFHQAYQTGIYHRRRFPAGSDLDALTDTWCGYGMVLK